MSLCGLPMTLTISRCAAHWRDDLVDVGHQLRPHEHYHLSLLSMRQNVWPKVSPQKATEGRPPLPDYQRQGSGVTTFCDGAREKVRSGFTEVHGLRVDSCRPASLILRES